MIPQRLGKYEIRREIGKGSMGVVYEGYDPLIRRRVAIKVIRDDELLDRGQLPELLARLQREAQAAGRLNHPGIVAVYDFGEDRTFHGAPVAFIAMEFVEGSDLKTLLESGGPLTVPEIARWMGGILAALQHAHDRGVTHRDVKPGNVMMLPDGTIKIADFGVARLDDSELTRTGSMIGTPQYMSPEQLLGLVVDGRSDLFACGVILYQLLTGTRPFSGSYATVVQKVLNEHPPAPTTINRTLAPDWDVVVHKAMAKAAGERYQNAAEFVAAIEQAVSGIGDDDATVIRPVPADQERTVTAALAAGSTIDAGKPAGPTASRPAAVPAGKPISIAAPAPSQRKWVPWPLLVAAAVGVGGLVLLAVLWWPRAPDEPSVAAAPAPVMTAPAPAAVTPAPEPPTAASAPAALPPPAPVIAVAPTMALQASAPRADAPASASAATVARAARPPESVRPSPAPSAAAPRVEGKPGAAVAPKPSPFAAEWQARRDAVQAQRSRLSFPAALALLLDLRFEDDRQKLLAIESLVHQRGPHMAAVLGVVNGHLAFAWRSGSSVEQAREAAMGRCAELRASGCATVMVDGELRRTAFVEFASGLGALGVADVRSGFMRSVNTALERAAAQQAAAPKPPPLTPPLAEKTAPVTPESPRPAAVAPAQPPTPAKEWADARAALRSGAGRGNLSGALGVLFSAQRSDEREAFAKFETAMQRLPWKSALAMSERNGWVEYGWSSREQRSEWAADAAVGYCKGVGGANCVVVMADGKFNDAAFLRFADQLGSRQQGAVRDALVRSLAKRF